MPSSENGEAVLTAMASSDAAHKSSQEQIRSLNHAMRSRLPLTVGADRFVVTRGIACLDIYDQLALIEAVKLFPDSDPENDPYAEHDFGEIELNGERYFWKIDYYDRSMRMASSDAADPDITVRVLTMMRADEY